MVEGGSHGAHETLWPDVLPEWLAGEVATEIVNDAASHEPPAIGTTLQIDERNRWQQPRDLDRVYIASRRQQATTSLRIPIEIEIEVARGGCGHASPWGIVG